MILFNRAGPFITCFNLEFRDEGASVLLNNFLKNLIIIVATNRELLFENLIPFTNYASI